MNKPFYSYVGKNTGDNRKLGIMRQFGLEGRALESLDNIGKIEEYSLNYNDYNNLIDDVRDKSKSWLADSLQSVLLGKDS